MDVFFYFFILFSFISLSTEALDPSCPSSKCSDGAPDIRLPFSVQGHHDQHCRCHGFELSCKLNQTTIHFPSYGDLVVKSISYDIKKLSLLDPKNCVHEVFLNLNLSLTPFQYYYVVKNFTYLNCSSRLPPSFDQVPCLSGSGYHVYVLDSSLEVPGSCHHVKTVAIPFSYTPFLSDNSFGLGLTWELTSCKDLRCSTVAYGKVPSITFFIFLVGLATIITKTYCSSKLRRGYKDQNQLESTEKLLGDSETLNPARNCNPDGKGVDNYQINGALKTEFSLTME